jgi:toxin-antitoxin system PIN domain toxin
MLLTDVNVLVYAFRGDVPDHRRYAAWLDGVINGDEAYGMADLVLSGFLRIVTHPRIFHAPASIEDALAFVEQVRGRLQCVVLAPGARHWEIFTRLCRTAGVRGNLVPDAYLAALAIESGSEWITTDRDFSRFPGLRWRHPLSN